MRRTTENEKKLPFSLMKGTAENEKQMVRNPDYKYDRYPDDETFIRMGSIKYW